MKEESDTARFMMDPQLYGCGNMANPKCLEVMSSPWGEETGEGGQSIKYFLRSRKYLTFEQNGVLLVLTPALSSRRGRNARSVPIKECRRWGRVTANLVRWFAIHAKYFCSCRGNLRVFTEAGSQFRGYQKFFSSKNCWRISRAFVS
jgi:hypothetical protein